MSTAGTGADSCRRASCAPDSSADASTASSDTIGPADATHRLWTAPCAAGGDASLQPAPRPATVRLWTLAKARTVDVKWVRNRAMTEKPRPNADAPVVDSDLKVDVGWASGSRHSHERRTRVKRTSCAQRTGPTE